MPTTTQTLCRLQTVALVIIGLLFLNLLFVNKTLANPATVNLAVAANFKTTLQQLIDAYSEQFPPASKPQLRMINGATGALYTQIAQGAPFDLFFAADSLRPQQLVEQQLADKNTLAVYAIGQTAVVLKAHSSVADAATVALCRKGINSAEQLRAVLTHKALPQRATIAIANPKTAPYGAVALELLEQVFEQRQQYRLVRGKNVLHAQQLLLNGNVDFALLSVSQQYLLQANQNIMADYLFCPVTPNLAPAVRQSMVIIRQANRNSIKHNTLHAFYRYILSPEARRIIERNGYFTDASSKPIDSAATHMIHQTSNRQQ